VGCENIILEFRLEKGIKRLFGTCKIYGSEEYKRKGCEKYPQHPDRLFGKFCGFRFEDENGNDVTEFRKNDVLVRLVFPKVEIIRKD